jgi:predicted enzyme related to lactoylglutathione lyase
MAHATPGHFIWYDHLAVDKEVAIAFYTDLFGWTPRPIQQGYTMFVGSQGPMAGTFPLPAEARKTGAAPHWSSNVHVADCDATVAQVRELGGRVITPPGDFPNVGRLAVIADPQGVSINVFAPANPMDLHDRSKHGEFTWHELATHDHEAAFAFYSRLLGWRKSRDFDMGADGKYLVYGIDGTDLGGMFTIPAARPTPAHWLYYIEVADLDDTIERAKSKGAKVRSGPMAVPGGARIAQLSDPEGAAFALHEAAKKS